MSDTLFEQVRATIKIHIDDHKAELSRNAIFSLSDNHPAIIEALYRALVEFVNERNALRQEVLNIESTIRAQIIEIEQRQDAAYERARWTQEFIQDAIKL